MELSSQVKGSAPDLQKSIDRIFKLVMESHRTVSSDVGEVLDAHEKAEQHIDHLNEERRRLEILYTAGIAFSSETEMKALMEKAIDIVVHELRADAGFIVLVDNTGEPTDIFARNMEPNTDSSAQEMSMSVVRQTLARAEPTKDLQEPADENLSSKNSIIRLGIKAVVCAPLVLDAKVRGAVYLDRRNTSRPFTQTELVFLLAFARQIVHGLETSGEILKLQDKLLTEATMKFSDLRQVFLCDPIIGTSKKLFDILKSCSKIAPTDASVLILGENGTGKDLLAHVIHQNSRRSQKPIVTINCSAIPHDLLESELFGYESGAFTGATKTKPGRLELADGGTVFLDEIAEMSLNLQAKLLRVIQTKEIERLGGIVPKRIDVRFIAATNRNIGEMIEKGTFREDLYYRLKVIELTMPPLRERREDVSALVTFFLGKLSPSTPPHVVSETALATLEQYSWPGNIRELENVIHRCVVLAKGNVIEVSDLPPELVEQTSNEPHVDMGRPLLDAETEFRRLYIIKTLKQAGSPAEAAKRLGINRTHFCRLLSQLEIQY
jgi:transcriptional regulator with GAF, ATPase, and Fis domain